MTARTRSRRLRCLRCSSTVVLRTGTRIVCADDVLEEAGLEVPEEEVDEVEKFREFLDSVSPEDFENPDPA